MTRPFVAFALLLALAACDTARVAPPRASLFPEASLPPEVEAVAINDGRSVEHCVALGFVTAGTREDPATGWPPANSLSPTLRNDAARRGGNYVESLPSQCHAGWCTETGMSYRCPMSTPTDVESPRAKALGRIGPVW